MAYPFNRKARMWIDGRKDYFATLQKRMYKNNLPLIWFHAASLGEFEQCRPLIEKIKSELPEYGIILTFFSPSGYEIRKNYEHADLVFYLPLDTPFNARKFVRVVNPRLALFAKYEFWYNFLNELDKKKIPALCFSALFRKDQIFFKPYGSFFRDILKKFDRIFLQNMDSVHLLEQSNIRNTEVAGDTRFDRVKQIAGKKRTVFIAENFSRDSFVLIAGSSWPEDMKILLPLINRKDIRIKTIIAPHEISENALKDIESRLEKPFIRYSKAAEADLKDTSVLLIDNIGMLSSLYQYGSVAYIGGAFGKGLHNILEPACFGLPIFFGPNFQKFREAVELYDTGCAFPVKTSDELTKGVILLMNDEQKRLSLGKKIYSYIEKNTGATDRIFNYCKKILTKS